MEIRFVSSLTGEDENYLAPALLKAIGAILDQLPITYTIRIETTGSRVFQHLNTGADGSRKAESDQTSGVSAQSSVPTLPQRHALQSMVG